MKLTLLTALCLLPVIALAQGPVRDKKGYFVINLPDREVGYGNFKSQVIDSQTKFDDFVRQVEEQKSWNNRAGFLKALRNAKVDFKHEILVLIRQTEGSVSTRVSLAAPELKDDKLVCVVQREDPRMGVTLLAEYCFAVAIDRGKAKEVEVWVSTKGEPNLARVHEVLKLPAK